MRVLFCLSFIFFGSQSWAGSGYLSCSDIFNQQLVSTLSFDELNQEVAPTLTKISTQAMADTILSTAQNKIAYEGFSPNLINALRRTLEILLQAEKAQELVELTYKNEMRRRIGKELLKPQDVFGMDIDLDLFGVEFPYEEIPIQEMDDRQLAQATWLASDRVKSMYISRAQQEDIFLNIGLKRSLEKLMLFGNERNYPASEFFDLEAREDSETIFTMFATFVRESSIREEVYRLAREGRLPWPKDRRFFNQQIFILSIYPELLPFLRRLPDLDFRYEIDFRSFDDIFPTSNALLRGGPGMASLSLIKQIENVHDDYVEWLESYINITVVESEVTDLSQKAENIANLHSYLRQAWNGFLATKGLQENQVRMLVEGDDKDLTLKIEAMDEDLMEAELLVGFYLSIIDKNHRTNYGQR